jgi:hypothetical protein
MSKIFAQFSRYQYFIYKNLLIFLHEVIKQIAVNKQESCEK